MANFVTIETFLVRCRTIGTLVVFFASTKLTTCAGLAGSLVVATDCTVLLLLLLGLVG